MSCPEVESLDWPLIRGKTFEFWVYPDEWDGSVMDLSGYTGRGEIRAADAATAALLATFTVTITSPPLTSTNLARALAADATANHYQVHCLVAASATDYSVAAWDTLMATEGAVAYYDIEGVSGAVVKLIARGVIQPFWDRTRI